MKAAFTGVYIRFNESQEVRGFFFVVLCGVMMKVSLYNLCGCILT